MPFGASEQGQKLPGFGGAFVSFNLSLYAYSHVNPIRYIDPDGRQTRKQFGDAGEWAAYDDAVSREEIGLVRPGRHDGADFITFSEAEGRLKFYDNKASNTGKTVNEASGLTRDTKNLDRAKQASAELFAGDNITAEQYDKINKAADAKRFDRVVTNAAPGSTSPARGGSKLEERGMQFRANTLKRLFGWIPIVQAGIEATKPSPQHAPQCQAKSDDYGC